LFALDSFEQGFEVSLAKAAAAFALDDFEEESRPVLYGTSEDLQHVAFVVTIGQDSQLLQLFNGLIDLANALLQLGVVRMGDSQKFDALFLQECYCADNILGRQSNVLHARCRWP